MTKRDNYQCNSWAAKKPCINRVAVGAEVRRDLEVAGTEGVVADARVLRRLREDLLVEELDAQ